MTTTTTLTEKQEQVIDQIKMISDGGEPPTLTEYNDHPDTFSQGTVYNHFDSWDEAVQIALPEENDLEDEEDSEDELIEEFKPELSRDEVVEQIHMLSDDSRPPSYAAFLEHPETVSHREINHHFGGWSNALDESFHTDIDVKEAKRERILAEIGMLADGESPPTVTEYNQHPETFSQNTVYQHFEGWNDAVKKAGFAPNIERKNGYTSEDLIEQIQMVAEQANPPSLIEYLNHPDTVGFRVLYHLPTSWSEALQSIEGDAEVDQKDIKREQILGEIEMLTDEDGPPTLAEYDDHPDTFSQSVIYNYFDDWDQAIKLAGHGEDSEYADVGYAEMSEIAELEYDQDVVSQELQMLSSGGDPPSSTEFHRHPDTASRTIVIRRFGTWDEALEAAGYEAAEWGVADDEDAKEIVAKRKKEKREQITSNIKRLADGDSPPTREEFDQDEEAPAATTTTTYFDSWNDAVESAGFEPNSPGRKQVYTDEDLINHIQRLSRNGIAPSHRTVNEDPDAPTVLVYTNRFGSWQEAVDRAGLEKSEEVYLNENILDHMNRLAENGIAPTKTEFDDDDEAPSSNTVINRFGSWDNAVQEADLKMDSE